MKEGVLCEGRRGTREGHYCWLGVCVCVYIGLSVKENNDIERPFGFGGG